MTRHLFVVNPLSREAPRLAAAAAAVCARLGLEHMVQTSGYAGETIEIVSREASRDGELRVYVLGGDGSLNEAVRGADGAGHVAITQIPCGTGNDFIRCFGGKDGFLEPEELIHGREIPLDLMEVTIDGLPPRFAVNICSAGVDADVAAGVRRHTWARRWGSKMPYNLSLVSAVVRGYTRRYGVTVDGQCLDGTYSLLACCNGQVYGGGFKACPDADPADGQLEFLLIKAVSRLTLARVVGDYAAGKYKEMTDIIRHIPGKSITIEGKKPFFVNYDGETIRARRVTFALSGQKLRFIVPEKVLTPSIR
ncbi:MAG: hypothetical protein LBI19_02300 [Oscillospiraceae bacterium]|jgi:diacylglycerol kinase family enzyme|nr:hypothetical protein [Oscillospiraceae bacterium]